MIRILDRTRHGSSTQYVEYQEGIARNHVLPLLRNQNVPFDLGILDVGCNKGGFAIAFSEELGKPVVGVDLSREDVDEARAKAACRGVDATFEVADICAGDGSLGETYGLILLRDVVEHLRDRDAALTNLRRLLHPRGYLYVTFPPWLGPYAGHQHNAHSALRFMPYLHALAPRRFLHLAEHWEASRADWLADERQICANRLTRARFERSVSRCGWNIVFRRMYLLRPAFARMGLPTIPNTPVARIPGLGELLTTECEYLLSAA